MPSRMKRGLSRRDFVTAAIAIGGSAALSACMTRETVPDLPQGPADLAEHSAIGQKTNTGIFQYMTMTRRGNSFVTNTASIPSSAI